MTKDSKSKRAKCGGSLAAESIRWAVEAQRVAASEGFPEASPGTMLIPGIGLTRITDNKQQVLFYGIKLPRSIAEGQTFDLFSTVGDHTNLREAHRIPWDEALAYRFRIGIGDDVALCIGGIAAVIYSGRIRVLTRGDGVLDSPLSFLPYSLFPGSDIAASNALEASRTILDPYRSYTVTEEKQTIPRWRIEGEPVAKMDIPIHIMGFGDGFTKLEGGLKFIKAIESEVRVWLYIIVDCFSVTYLR